MKTTIMHLFTRTPLHVGAGSSVGAIDMPIQRERHTQIPIVPGSGLKGVLRDLWNGAADKAEQEVLFGPESNADKHVAGNLVVGEARVVCFPVRSAAGSFAWLTCPLALQRYARDTGAAMPTLDAIDDYSCLAGEKVVIQGKDVVLEEYAFTFNGSSQAAAELLKEADSLCATLADRLVVVSDGLFSHFCSAACEVQQRVRIEDGTGVVATGALFNQENVPSETLFYAVLGQRHADKVGLDKLDAKLKDYPVLQIGGDETIGLGVCSVALKATKGGAQ